MKHREKAKGEFICGGLTRYPNRQLITSFMFVEFKNENDANLAITNLHNHPFDARHTFKINRFTDIERYADLDETYVEPELEEYTPRVRFKALAVSL